MTKLTYKLTLHELIPKSKYPQLYSKRGLEKNRIKVIIPKNRNELSRMVDEQGNEIITI